MRVVAIAAEDDLYTPRGRRVMPVLRFGGALFRHLARHGRRYDVVHTSAMSAWSALAAASLSRRCGFRLVLDWWEVWPLAYWWTYLGPAAGAAAWLLQWQIARVPHQPIVYSDLHARRLQRLRGGRQAPKLRGLLPAMTPSPAPRRAEPRVIYAGRHIPEKQVPAIVGGVACARERLPSLSATLYGDGPSRAEATRAVQEAGLQEVVDLPGFVDEPQLREVLGGSLCLVLLSRREGYGLVVAEAAALGVPSVVLRHPDSAATELIVDEVNGLVCASAAPSDVASAILRVHAAGYALRQRTLAWFHENAGALSIESSLPQLLAIYRGECREGRPDE